MKNFNFLFTTFMRCLNFIFWSWIIFVMWKKLILFFKPSSLSSSLENWFSDSGSHYKTTIKQQTFIDFQLYARPCRRWEEIKEKPRDIIGNFFSKITLYGDIYIVHTMLHYKFFQLVLLFRLGKVYIAVNILWM